MTIKRLALVVALLGSLFAAGGLVAQGAGTPLDRAAPDIAGAPWLNSEPLTIAGLRGRVVFVEFWTYG